MKKINIFFNTAHLFKVYLASVMALFIMTFTIFTLMDYLFLVDNDILNIYNIIKLAGVMSLLVSLLIASTTSLSRKSDASRKITDEFKERAKKVKSKAEAIDLWQEVKDFWKVNSNGSSDAIRELKTILNTSYTIFDRKEKND